MRLARYFPIVVLAGFVCQTAVPFTARAGDSAAVATTDASPALQNNGRIVDGSVQQAGYYDSRPQPNATAIKPSEPDPNHRNGALFHGAPLHFPKLPFSRRTPTNRTSTHPSQSASNQASPNNTDQMRQRTANQTAAGRSVPSRVSAAPQSAGTSNNPTARNAASRPQQPIRQAAAPYPQPLATRPTAAAPADRNTSRVSPWTTTPAIAAVAVPTAVGASAAVAAVPGHRAPLSPADQLVVQAHDWSTTANSEQDYFRIIETCRRAQASHCSPETAKYANKLTAWAFNRRGQLRAEAGQDKDAILDFDDAIRADSTCWRAVHNRGVLLAQAGQFERAFDDFSRTIQFNPRYAKAYSNRAALFMVANNLHAALQDYNRAIELDANLAVAHRGCGRVCQLLGRMEDASGHYDAAVQLAPNDAYAAACRADLLTDIGRYSDALAEYNRALQIDSRSSQAHCGSAWLLATCPDSSVRNPELAVERAKKAIELSGHKDAVSFDSLAAAQASAGDFTAAMQSIRKAIELAPADERDSYKDRLVMYQQAKPYRIAPVERIALQTGYAAGSGERGAGSRRF